MKIVCLVFLWLISVGWLVPLNMAYDQYVIHSSFLEKAVRNNYSYGQLKNKEFILAPAKMSMFLNVSQMWFLAATIVWGFLMKRFLASINSSPK